MGAIADRSRARLHGAVLLSAGDSLAAGGIAGESIVGVVVQAARQLRISLTTE
jgi:hypothetical protein